MKAVIQRVTYARVRVDEKTVGEINKGYLVLLGVGQNDTEQDADKIVDKLTKLRIFSDENDKINLSLNDVNGEILVVSQFTLYADCKHGNRPSFINAGKPEKAEQLYEYFAEQCKKYVSKVEKGVFGADMKVELLNDGPFTIVLNCENGKIENI